MENGQPSFTALTAAAARAAHLVVDGEPVIFADTLALALLGERAEELLSYHTSHGTHPVLAGARAQVTCRSRYTEDALGRAAGVDHPATQDWKRRALAHARVTVPDGVTFVPADLATGALPGLLAAAGFD
ncbi:MAG TPA: class I SAM-dependent methyltransferase, partial [Actinocrinis sp.]